MRSALIAHTNQVALGFEPVVINFFVVFAVSLLTVNNSEPSVQPLSFLSFNISRAPPLAR